MAEHSPGFSGEQLRKVARAVVENSPNPMAVIDSERRLIASNERFRALSGWAQGPASIFDISDSAWKVADFEAAIDGVLVRKEAFFDLPLPWSGPLFVSGRTVQAGNEEPPPLVVLVFSTLTARDRAEGVLADDPLLAQEIIGAVREPMIVLDYDRNVRWANNAFCLAFRIDRPEIAGRPFEEVAGGAFAIPALQDRIRAVLARDEAFEDLPVEGDFGPLGNRAFLVGARRIDHLRLILLTLDDVTQRHSDARHTDTLVKELAHRAKNLLAVVQSLAFQTQADSVEAFRTAFIGRAQALALAQGALIDTQWHHADLEQLIRDVVRVQAGAFEDRIRIHGPTVHLSPLQATTFALVINELVTNALAHGSLTGGSGDVDIAWRRTPDRLFLTWTERGGPAIDAEPESGFGTTLITRAANLQLGGLAELSFERDGLVGRIEMALTD